MKNMTAASALLAAIVLAATGSTTGGFSGATSVGLHATKQYCC